MLYSRNPLFYIIEDHSLEIVDLIARWIKNAKVQDKKQCTYTFLLEWVGATAPRGHVTLLGSPVPSRGLGVHMRVCPAPRSHI